MVDILPVGEKQGPADHATTLAVAGEQRAPDQLNRVGDIAVALALLMIAGPLILIAAVAIKCETQGPAFLRADGMSTTRRSTSLGFRTKVNGRMGERTKVGRFLEYTRIDVLPQLIDVARGKMGFFYRHGRSPSFLESWLSR